MEGAQRFVQLAQEAVATRKRFSVCLSGGSTPRRMHRLLARPPLRDRVEWSRVHVFWGDERFVPPDDPESTFLMARETLLDHVPIPGINIHAMPTVGLSPEEAARRYAETLTTVVGNVPRFDLIYLGMGPDGHTASIFPGHPEATRPSTALVTVVRNSPKPPPTRLTLTFQAINAAANVLFLVAGSDKAQTIGAVFGDAIDPARLPAQGVRPKNGRLVWLLDEAAAQALPMPP